jgi:hypothetical protein
MKGSSTRPARHQPQPPIRTSGFYRAASAMDLCSRHAIHISRQDINPLVEGDPSKQPDHSAPTGTNQGASGKAGQTGGYFTRSRQRPDQNGTHSPANTWSVDPG